MSEEDKKTEEAVGPVFPPIDEQWKAPKTDTVIVIRFIGDTPNVAEVRGAGLSVGHFWAAANRLNYMANRYQTKHDDKNDKLGILTTDQLPDEKLMRP